MNENNIFSYLKTGDERKAIEWMYKNVYPSIRRYLLSNKANEEQVEDLFQDALIKVLLKIRKKQITEITNIENYLFIMVKNSWTTTVVKNRKVQYENEFTFLKDDSVLAMDDNQEEKRNQMERMLDLIGDTCKEILKMTFYLGYSMEEVAEQIGFNNANVAKSYNYRCKKRLLEKVKEDKLFRSVMSI